MGRSYTCINSRLASFVLSQPVFFVATAPVSDDGLVNCSPKSNNGELAVLDTGRIAYLDRTGSGIETIAHLRENGRIVLMFCAFENKPRIVRIHGRGAVVERDDKAFAQLATSFAADDLGGSRAIVVVSAQRISESCGYGVPLMSFSAHRSLMAKWAQDKGEQGVRQYWESNNAESLDGLAGIVSTKPARIPRS